MYFSPYLLLQFLTFDNQNIPPSTPIFINLPYDVPFIVLVNRVSNVHIRNNKRKKAGAKVKALMMMVESLYFGAGELKWEFYFPTPIQMIIVLYLILIIFHLLI